MSDQGLIRSFADGVLTLSLNRPEKLNALDIGLFDLLRDSVAEAAEDADVRVLLLRGEGKAFSAGGDLRGTGSDLGPEERIAPLRRRVEVTQLLHEMPKPTVAMLRGAVAGAAVGIALGCDLRVASRTTVLVPAFAKAGFSGDFGSSYMLARFLGPARARQYLFLGERIASEEADALGLFNWLVDDDQLEARTLQVCRELADGPGLAFRLMKENLNHAETATLAENLDVESANMVKSIFSEDSREAVRAFLEKRTPRFSGR